MRYFLKDRATEFESYIGVQPKSFAIFFLAVALAAAAATGVYWSVFGFKHWNTEMTTAQRILLAAATTPAQAPAVQNAGATGQYVCPVHGAVGMPRFDAAGIPRCPVGGEVMQFAGRPLATATAAAFAGG
ncbi:hypothetical protein [Solidesulfovibrio magneticus]|uniref:Uncharacterized protein n=1 Tax=Solidesulfovibrio magneticus (strain ATCC 700980 / DSM 13731 / RS-1) TaxID=573370 RepID=C4XPR4_SOLM1|nr:hypothetical protein [Solidesulfovibrio magneticus]BAH77614.1 hypothetical protein DMR_41230 [Solidesulfovibrio magneticus RS-1]